MLFLVGVGVVIGLSLGPTVETSGSGFGDKLGHVLAYAVLAASGMAGYEGAQRRWLVALGLVALGAGLEVAQGLTSHRTASQADQIANTIGTGLGALAMVRLEKAMRNRRPRDDGLP